MSMPHKCRCGICGYEMSPQVFWPGLSDGTGGPFGAHPICCHKCNEGKPLTMMVLCPTCGNKRCPKASDHTLACTNSNESGQAGSIY